MKNLTILLFLCSSLTTFSQEITGNELLEKTIQFHDPNNNWPVFKGELFVTMETPKGAPRESKITINLPKEYFSVTAKRDTVINTYTIHKGDCSIEKAKENQTLESLKKDVKAKCERAKLYKNYYTYLYGLPMKLKDEGTIIHNQVNLEKFNGEMYLALKVTYKENVGKDTWYFYFDPETYAMEAYQFFKDESKNDGEYILLSGLETINGIKMPKKRAWYYNKNAQYLGTDILSSTKK